MGHIGQTCQAWLNGLVVWFLLRVQEVPGSNPGWAQEFCRCCSNLCKKKTKSFADIVSCVKRDMTMKRKDRQLLQKHKIKNKSNMQAKLRVVRMYRYHSGSQNSVLGLAAVVLFSTPFPSDGILPWVDNHFLCKHSLHSRLVFALWLSLQCCLLLFLVLFRSTKMPVRSQIFYCTKVETGELGGKQEEQQSFEGSEQKILDRSLLFHRQTNSAR